MDDVIRDEELLYRAVRRSVPDSFINGKPMPSLFIDKRGASFSRDGGREEKVILDHLASKIKHNHKPDVIGCVKITAHKCRDAGTYPCPMPTQNDVYHAEVHESEDIVQISLLKAMIMCDLCEVVVIEENSKQFK